MQEFGEADVVCEIVGLLLADIPRYLAEFHTALASGDLPTARRAAHTMKGAASNVSAREVCAVAKRIETALREGQTDVSSDVPALDAACERLARELTAWVVTLQASSSGAR
jgi:HPt (histidine-containing phosphotransfer) domain-containing protein